MLLAFRPLVQVFSYVDQEQVSRLRGQHQAAQFLRSQVPKIHPVDALRLFPTDRKTGSRCD